MCSMNIIIIWWSSTHLMLVRRWWEQRCQLMDIEIYNINWIVRLISDQLVIGWYMISHDSTFRTDYHITVPKYWFISFPPISQTNSHFLKLHLLSLLLCWLWAIASGDNDMCNNGYVLSNAMYCTYSEMLDKAGEWIRLLFKYEIKIS